MVPFLLLFVCGVFLSDINRLGTEYTPATITRYDIRDQLRLLVLLHVHSIHLAEACYLSRLVPSRQYNLDLVITM
ncbi:hypothetical protein GALMADRAFT_231490 [Galerina marginata CBS 339.88]|uniref:Secreted protein n=1 Tax=Galerina marginata (strain CBS 339.88) TaxID=685588 RepID=A0A067SNG0_GALM3|nr:hypothetical protein GALMADRAFT_231490 [Galerina marginata CBS 339.88]